MSYEEKSGAGLTLLTFILGAASGAAVALLYAPASGRDTRDYLSERARAGRDEAAAAAERAKEYVQEGGKVFSSAVAQGRQAVEQGRQTVSSAFEQGREAYNQAKSRESA